MNLYQYINLSSHLHIPVSLLQAENILDKGLS